MKSFNTVTKYKLQPYCYVENLGVILTSVVLKGHLCSGLGFMYYSIETAAHTTLNRTTRHTRGFYQI